MPDPDYTAQAEAPPVTGWQPIATAPPGLVDGQWTYVLFSGYSKSGSFTGLVVVSGWMGKTHDGRYEPVHNYSYKLVITHWMPLPPPPATPEPNPPGETGGSLGRVGG